MGDKNEVLANFQALSGIEDIGICLDVLEQKEWDLTAAVNSVLPDSHEPPQPSSLPLQPRGHVTSEHVSYPLPHVPHTLPLVPHTLPLVPHSLPQELRPPSVYMDLTDSPSPSHHSVNIAVTAVTSTDCRLGVYYQNSLIPLQIPITATITQLKERLEQVTGIPSARQSLTGWPSHPSSDQTRLCDLCINSVFHVRLEELPQLDSTEGAGPGRHGNRGGEDEDIVALEEAIDNTHHSEPAPDPPITLDSSSPVSSLSGVASEDFYGDGEGEGGGGEGEGEGGMEEIMFEDDRVAQSSSRAMREPLIPENCPDPSDALQHFTQQFELRYGATHPLFFIGSLSDAVQEATARVTNSKPMLIYLHHDASILSNVFCSELLCKESIVSYLTNNFITWAWDLTRPPHRKQLLDMIAACFGPMARSNISDIHSNHLPVLLIVLKIKGAVAIRNIVQGETNIDALMATLLNAVEEHQIQREADIKEEQERAARERMIAEQNQAFQASLLADREKVKQRDAQLRAEEEEKMEKEAIRQCMASIVPQEPGTDCEEKISTLRIRLPNGSINQRRFLGRHTIQDLLNYFGSLDYPVQDYKVLTSFPRKDLSSLDPCQSLESAGLCPQETLFLEER